MPKNKTRKFVKVDEEIFVKEVQKRPIIYDHTHKDHKKINLRSRAWTEISEFVDIPAEECKTRWRSLRDSMIKNMKLEPCQTPYVHYSLLEFLVPFLSRNKAKKLKRTNSTVESAMFTVELQDTMSNDQSEPEIRNLEDQPEGLQKYDFERTSETTEDPLPNTYNVESVNQNTVDPDERFLLSCAPILKRLNNKKNILAKIKIQTILYELEFNEKYTG